MAWTNMTDEILRAEGYLMQDHDEQAIELLSRLAEDAEEYVDRNCPTTETLQWFSFPTMFDRLAYRRVEDDPRELRDVEEPLDRLYSDLALAYVKVGDYAMAIEALKRAIRWNPMDCGARLDLADLFRVEGDVQEYLALTYTVFERASDAAAAGQRDVATRLTLRARDLVGEPAAIALLELIRGTEAGE